MRKINFKELIISILIPLAVGFISALLSNSSDAYGNFIKPSFSPPGYLFPIVWTILYILMGISSYIVYKSNDPNKDKALKTYALQLIVNGLWSIIFFNFELYLFAFIWILLLIFLVVIMIIRFIKINKVAGYIQIPYLLWLLFAAYLNFAIYLLN